MVDVDADMTPGTIAPSETPHEAPSDSPQRVFLRASSYFLIALLPLTIAWSLTNPMFASPDEPVHLIRSQGVVRGDLTSPYDTDGISGGVCFAMDATVTADCQDLSWDASRTTAADNADGYPPMFHFVAGIPNLFVSGLGGAYLTRLWLGTICASLLALAAGLLWTWRPSRWTITGFLLGCTPMVIFLISTVNPSGLTTALASVIWASGIVIFAPSGAAPTSIAYPMLLVSASLFPMLRRDAVFFEIAIFVVLWSLTRRSDWPALLRQRWLQATAVCFTVSATLTFVLWSGSAADSFAAGADSADSGRFAGLGDLGYYLLSVMGWFGWLDSPMTNETYMIATVVLGSSIVVAIAGSSGQQARASWSASSRSWQFQLQSGWCVTRTFRDGISCLSPSDCSSSSGLASPRLSSRQGSHPD